MPEDPQREPGVSRRSIVRWNLGSTYPGNRTLTSAVRRLVKLVKRARTARLKGETRPIPNLWLAESRALLLRIDALQVQLLQEVPLQQVRLRLAKFNRQLVAVVNPSRVHWETR